MTDITHKSKDRLNEIDKAKGLAILLVVLGHLNTPGMPPNVEWYFTLKFFIYKFHMPLFMFLSGVVFFYTYKDVNSLEHYKKYALSKIMRLAPGFIIFGLLILFGKMYLSAFLHVDNLNNDISSAIYDIVLMPTHSVAGSLWYIYVLLEFYLLMPILLLLTKRNLYVLVAAGIILHFVPITSYLALNFLFENAIYFFMGIAITKNYKLFIHVVNKYLFVFLLIFGLSFFSIMIFPDNISKLIIGLASIPALVGLVSSPVLIGSNYLLVCAKYTFAIYLMNTIAIGLTKGLLLKYMDFHEPFFVVFSLFYWHLEYFFLSGSKNIYLNIFLILQELQINSSSLVNPFVADSRSQVHTTLTVVGADHD